VATATAAGAAGLLVGLVVPVIGVLAGFCLVLYFTGAVVTVARAAVVLAHPVATNAHGTGGRFLGAEDHPLSTISAPDASRTLGDERAQEGQPASARW